MTAIDDSQWQALGTEVAVGDIDRELHRFFSGGEPSSPQNPAGIARASLLNLAIYSEDADSVGELTTTIEELTRETACRAILILAQAGGPASVRSWVQAHCRLSEQGEKTVCTEQVSFLLSGADASLVRNTVFAHLDSDLPLVFWWGGELSDVFEERLYSRIDRFIVDSATWAQPSNQFLRLARALTDSKDAFVVHDLAYTRSYPARMGIARVFDDPASFDRLDSLESFEISFRPGHRISALWLTAWLSGRLKAKLDTRKSTGEQFLFRLGSGRELTISCRPDANEANDDTEAIHEVMIQLGAEGEIAIRHDSDSGFWKLGWDLSQGPEREKLYPGKARSDADLVAEILIRAGRNRAMTEAMPLLRELVVI